MNALVQYLSTLNTAETQWSLWVNPENIENFQIRQDCFENGGLLDDLVRVGNLNDLSFGFQSMQEAIEEFLKNYPEEIVYRGKKVKINKDGILTAYCDDYLGQEFRDFLESEAKIIIECWSQVESEIWVFDKLPEILAAYKEQLAEWQAA